MIPLPKTEQNRTKQQQQQQTGQSQWQKNTVKVFTKT